MHSPDYPTTEFPERTPHTLDPGTHCPPALHAVILCGGSGTRLWPLSRQQAPKQFVPLMGGKSLLTLTAERLQPLLAGNPSTTLSLLTAAEHRFMAREAIAAAGLRASLILEPQGRNTAPAIVAAALRVQESHGPESLLLVVPADNFIPDRAAFARAVGAGIGQALEDHWVIAGVLPSFPATGYGYIALAPADADQARQCGLHPQRAYPVERFVEKPALEQAQHMLLEGRYFWNAGIFLVKAGVAIASATEHCPGMVETLAACLERSPSTPDGDLALDASFAQAQNISIDYAVLERHSRVAMVPFAGAWSDVGSWTSVAELTTTPDARGNRIHGKAQALCGSTRNYVYAPDRLVVTVGVEDLLIVDTPDAVLVAHQDAAEKVKEAVGELDRASIAQARAHRRVARPWGSYDAIDAGERFLVKRITVNPGAALSLQLHHHRAEHWIVVRGTARVTRGEEIFLISENQSTYIPLGVRHRLENPGKLPLEMIEVQSGSYLDEDDIVRFSDHYGRA